MLLRVAVMLVCWHVPKERKFMLARMAALRLSPRIYPFVDSNNSWRPGHCEALSQSDPPLSDKHLVLKTLGKTVFGYAMFSAVPGNRTLAQNAALSSLG